MKINNVKLVDFEKSRYERKYVISEISEYEIEHVIKIHPALFSEIFYKRQVNNIYFDSHSMRSFQEHLGGIADRLKIRIRWYGKMFGKIENPILEIKVKRNELGNKLHFPVKSFIFEGGFGLQDLKRALNNSGFPKWLLEELKISVPVLLNSYKRKYFESKDKNFRMTLDSDLNFFNISGNSDMFLEKIDSDEKVLELKYDTEHYKDAEKITQDLPFTLMACSKFISGVEGLEL